ncbi:MAG: cytochrome c peroxidase [Myxococcota bacterium]
MTKRRGKSPVRRHGWTARTRLAGLGLAVALATSFGALACLDSIGQGTKATSGKPGAEATSATAAGGAPVEPRGPDGWRESERSLLRSLAIDALPPVPPDPSNRVADDPDAARLGQLLFFDARLSSNGAVACATCHEPERFFTDGRAVSQGVGATNRNAPTVVGSAYAPWLFWDGRRDSLWAQALAPFESAAEMNVSRVEVVRQVARDPEAARLFRSVFGRDPIEGDPARLPRRASPFGDPATQDAWARMPAPDREAIDRSFADLGKALAAYQRRLVPGPGRFDRYVRSLGAAAAPSAEDGGDALSPLERQGLALFLDPARTQCLRCHNGPLLTNQAFHRIGTELTADGFPEFGRFLGIQAALVDPFNCLGPFSDAKPEACRELRFLRRDHIEAETGKFKTPTLRGLSQTAPYMHDGRMATLEVVIEHYRHPPPRSPDPTTAHELLPLTLTDEEARALVAFLHTLDGEVAADARWLAPPGKSAASPAQPTAR